MHIEMIQKIDKNLNQYFFKYIEKIKKITCMLQYNYIWNIKRVTRETAWISWTKAVNHDNRIQEISLTGL